MKNMKKSLLTEKQTGGHMATEFSSKKIEFSDYFEVVEYAFKNRWSDGLAIVPPIPDKVEELINYVRRDPQEVIGEVDINPLIVLEEGKGAKAIDALVLLHDAEKRPELQ